MHRRLYKGTTVYAKVEKNDCIHEEAAKICKAFKPVGPLNIQLRLDKDNNPICFELNVRFSGTTAMRTAFGFRDVEAMIKEYVLHEDIDIPVVGNPEGREITETSECNPLSYYHKTKLIQEKFVQSACENGIQGIILRIPSPIGPKQPVK